MLKKRILNDRLMLAERGFLDAEGLRGRRWFRHLVSISIQFSLILHFLLSNAENGTGKQFIVLHIFEQMLEHISFVSIFLHLYLNIPCLNKCSKLQIYGPRNSIVESKLEFFPGIVDAIYGSPKLNKEERQQEIQHEIWRVARAIQRAAGILKGDLV